MNIVEICNEANWQEQEKYWINYYRKIFKLCNHHDGGLGCSGRKVSEKDKERIKNIGYKQSYFSENEKLDIWKEIQNKKTFKEIIINYPKVSISSYNAIKNGGLWRQITGLSKPLRTKNEGFNNHKSRKVFCSVTNKTYESARQAWLSLYSNQYKYSYFRCMLSGHNNNKTTLSYIT